MRAIETSLDNLWRKRVREKFNNRCCMCGSNNNLECHHGVAKRRMKSTRWDIRNGFLLCTKDHAFVENNPNWFEKWVRSKIGDDLYDEIKRQSRVPFHGEYEKWKEHLKGE
jgi:hypothetical protein